MEAITVYNVNQVPDICGTDGRWVTYYDHLADKIATRSADRALYFAHIAKLEAANAELVGALKKELIDAEALLCDVHAGYTENQCASRIRALLAGDTQIGDAKYERSVTINDYALLRAVESRGGIFSGTDVTIEWMDGHEDGNGYVIYDTEYPDEGSMMLDHGPLTEDFECIVCHKCGNAGNMPSKEMDRGYADCTNCSPHRAGSLASAKQAKGESK
jgi:hypothetical protein